MEDGIWNMKQYCHPPMFTRWRCLTHDAGSYNFNWLLRHDIENVCEIITDVTVGVVKPKTYGRPNGDIRRSNYPEWSQKVKLEQSHKAIKEKWELYIKKKREDIKRFRSSGRLADKVKKVFHY